MKTGRPYFIVNVEAAIKKADKYLIIKRSQKEEHSPGTLSLPGGKVDVSEVSPGALEEALRREILEETDLRIGDLSYVESKSFTMDTGEMCLSICFTTDDFEGEAKAQSACEVDEVLWLSSVDIMANPNCPPWTRQSIAAVEVLKGH